VWLWGLTTNRGEPSRLVEEAASGDRKVAVSAYIHDEVTSGLRQLGDASNAQMRFNETIANLENVKFPDQNELGRTYAAEVRRQSSSRLLGTILEIQAKDAPVFTFAFDVGGDSTLFVADSGFSLEPAEHNVTNVEMQQVSTS